MTPSPFAKVSKPSRAQSSRQTRTSVSLKVGCSIGYQAAARSGISWLALSLCAQSVTSENGRGGPALYVRWPDWTTGVWSRHQDDDGPPQRSPRWTGHRRNSGIYGAFRRNRASRLARWNTAETPVAVAAIGSGGGDIEDHVHHLRNSATRGRPSGRRPSMNGSISAHFASAKSLA